MANGVQPERKSVLKELTELGKAKGQLSNKEILDAIGEMDIDAEAMERFYDSLETNGIEIVETLDDIILDDSELTAIGEDDDIIDDESIMVS